ncbi:MAG: hypothetical protein U0787_05390 [Polyangia bacterium]
MSPAPTCGAVGQACCAPGNTCASGGNCVGGYCQSCGGAGQACCAGRACDGNDVCTGNGQGICSPCGNPGQPCCVGNGCGSVVAGNVGCCVNNVCSSAGSTCPNLTGTCANGSRGTCGGAGQPPCTTTAKLATPPTSAPPMA